MTSLSKNSYYSSEVPGLIPAYDVRNGGMTEQQLRVRVRVCLRLRLWQHCRLVVPRGAVSYGTPLVCDAVP